MSIRLIAQELYKLRQAVETLEKEMENAPFERRANLDKKLQRARSEMDAMRKILDGRIDRR